MPNPDPVQTPEFKAKQKPPVFVDGVPLAKKPIPVKFDAEVDAVLRNQNDRQSLIRRYVREGLQRDRLISVERTNK
ncbi:MAG: hypothetical protein AAF810_17730 [Cyanobacteria bacterium P01_D01_bin.36]